MTSPEKALKYTKTGTAKRSPREYRAPNFSIVRQAYKRGDCTRAEMLADRRLDQLARKGTTPLKKSYHPYDGPGLRELAAKRRAEFLKAN